MPPTKDITGRKLLQLARKHIGEQYILGTLAPKNNANWIGPWDCAEFASWLTYQIANVLYGCDKVTGNPASADAYTGHWARDAQARGKRISVQQAARIPGAAVLRVPQTGAIGHIVISDGKGGTIEAHSSARGVIESSLSDRRWDMGILVPGIEYTEAVSPVEVKKPQVVVYRLRKPFMKGTVVKTIQRALRAAGFDPGGTKNPDGIFGPQTQAAVIAFQLSQGLVPDGEVGPKTAQALGVKLPPV